MACDGNWIVHYGAVAGSSFWYLGSSFWWLVAHSGTWIAHYGERVPSSRDRVAR